MIGDWVFCTYPSINTPVKVAEIKTVGDNELKTVVYHDDIRLVFCEKYLDPIPLTAEILEKNGFKIVHGFGYSESYPTYGWGYHKGLRDYASVDVTFYDEPIGGVSRLVKMETASKKDDGINSIHSCDIESVHDLQHALRLCGILKDITL